MLRDNLDMLYEVSADALDSLGRSNQIQVFNYLRHYQYSLVFNTQQASAQVLRGPTGSEPGDRSRRVRSRSARRTWHSLVGPDLAAPLGGWAGPGQVRVRTREGRKGDLGPSSAFHLSRPTRLRADRADREASARPGGRDDGCQRVAARSDYGCDESQGVRRRALRCDQRPQPVPVVPAGGTRERPTPSDLQAPRSTARSIGSVTPARMTSIVPASRRSSVRRLRTRRRFFLRGRSALARLANGSS